MRSRILACLLFLILSLSVCGAQYNLFENPHVQFLDTSGRPMAGGMVYTYTAGTTTPAPTYKDAAGVTVNTNPVVLDSGGFGTIYLDQTKTYKVVMKNSQGVQQWSVDNVSGSLSSALIPISSLLPATGANTINNGSDQQYWRWQLTGNTVLSALALGEYAPSNDSAPYTDILDVTTMPGSTAWPLRVAADFQPGTSSNGFGVTPTTGNIQALGTAVFIGPFRATNITGPTCVEADAQGNLIGAGSLCLSASTFAAPPPLGNVTPNTVAGTTGLFTGAVTAPSFTGNLAGNVNGATGTFSGLITAAGMRDTTLGGPGCVETDANGNFIISPGHCATTSGATPISALGDAQNANSVVNGSWEQTWAWSLNGTSNGLTVTETTPSTATAGTLLRAVTLAGSTAWPFRSTNSGKGVGVMPTGDLQALGAANFVAPAGVSLAGGGHTTPGWVADATTWSAMSVNPGGAAGFTFFGNSGLTPGSPFAPNLIASINSTGGWTGSTGNFSGAVNTGTLTVNGVINHAGVLQTPVAATNIAAGAHVTTGWIADQPTAEIIGMGGGAHIFYANGGLTPGAAFTPAVSFSFSVPSGLQLAAVQPFLSSGAANLYLLGGAHFSGLNWIADSTAPTMISVPPNGVMAFYSNPGATIGAAYSPTLQATLDSAGSFNANGSITSNFGSLVGAAMTLSGNATIGGTLTMGASTTVGLANVGTLNVNTNVGSGGGGLKHIRFASCTIPASGPNSTCDGAANWVGPAFSSASYTIVCQPSLITNAAPITIDITSQTPTGFTYQLANLGAGAIANNMILQCIAMHD